MILPDLKIGEKWLTKRKISLWFFDSKKEVLGRRTQALSQGRSQ
jgi:hypothetical protein